jgi:hypothetical protein
MPNGGGGIGPPRMNGGMRIGAPCGGNHRSGGGAGPKSAGSGGGHWGQPGPSSGAGLQTKQAKRHHSEGSQLTLWHVCSDIRIVKDTGTSLACVRQPLRRNTPSRGSVAHLPPWSAAASSPKRRSEAPPCAASCGRAGPPIAVSCRRHSACDSRQSIVCELRPRALIGPQSE